MLSGAKACKSCRSRQELSNEYLLAQFGVGTAENEPLKVPDYISENLHLYYLSTCEKNEFTCNRHAKRRTVVGAKCREELRQEEHRLDVRVRAPLHELRALLAHGLQVLDEVGEGPPQGRGIDLS